MLGRHPQLYGVPELHLLRYETVGEFLHGCSRAMFPMTDGLLRTIAQIVFEEQSTLAVERARSWLRRRSDWTTGFLIEEIADFVSPARLVEKSPSTVFEMEYMLRSLEMFPDARFLHLTRHPMGFGKSIMKLLQLPRAQPGWLLDAAADPAMLWYSRNRTICEFLEVVPQHLQMRVRGEDLLSEPDLWVREIARWLEIDTDDDAVSATKHPERSPYACFGPPNALYGLDFFFLQDPVLRPARAEVQTLIGPLPWNTDKAGFMPELVDLARTLGYE
jgi:hypothetical protein